MKNVVLISHGEMAQGVKSSLEMLVGKQETVHVVSLREDSDNIEFEKQFLEKMNTLTHPTVVIADLLGGTPCNVAIKNYSDNDQVSILAGMSLALVMEVLLNDQSPIEEVVNTARKGMVDVKREMTKVEEKTKTNQPVEHLEQYKEFKGKANIINTRIDERLIHGQVAGIWSTSLNTQRIIVANDEAASDPLQKTSLRMAAPTSMRLSVLTVEEAAKNIESGKYGNQRLFLLFKNPKDVSRYLEAGGHLETLNVGNMSFKEGTEEVTKNIQVFPEEKVIFNQIAEHGIKITAQLVPNEPVIDFMKKLNNH